MGDLDGRLPGRRVTVGDEQAGAHERCGHLAHALGQLAVQRSTAGVRRVVPRGHQPGEELAGVRPPLLGYGEVDLLGTTADRAPIPPIASSARRD